MYSHGLRINTSQLLESGLRASSESLKVQLVVVKRHITLHRLLSTDLKAGTF